MSPFHVHWIALKNQVKAADDDDNDDAFNEAATMLTE